MKIFHHLFISNAFAIFSMSIFQSAISCSSAINDRLCKRADIPNLNELPPPEEDTFEHPSDRQFGLELIAPVKKTRSDLFRKKKMRRIEDIGRPLPSIYGKPHWQTLPSSAVEGTVRKLDRSNRLSRELTLDERRKRSRLSSQRHRAKWTEEQKQQNYDRDNAKRKKRLNQLSESEKEVIRAKGRARYHKHKDKLRTAKKDSAPGDKKHKRQKMNPDSEINQ